MARGSIVKRCLVCRRNGLSGLADCNHREVVYVIVYRVGNKQRWEKVGPNKKEAELRLAEINSQLNSGTYHKSVDILFEDFAVKWLEQYAKCIVKPSTFRSYENTIRCHLNPAFKGIFLKNINIESIQSFVSKSLAKRKPKTVNNILILLKTMLKYAKRWGYIKENPAIDIENLPIQHQEMDYLTPEEIKKVLDCSPEPLRTIILIAVLTGIRRGELLSLQWGDIDWNNNNIFIKRSIFWFTRKESNSEIRKWIFLSPKSKRSVRSIILSPILKKALEIHRINCSVGPYDLVFCSSNGNPLDPDGITQKKFHDALITAGIRKIRFHDLRHTYTSLLIAQGENVKFIQSQLGHASIQTTLDRYGHLLPSCNQGVGGRIDNQIFGQIEKNHSSVHFVSQVLAETSKS